MIISSSASAWFKGGKGRIFLQYQRGGYLTNIKNQKGGYSYKYQISKGRILHKYQRGGYFTIIKNQRGAYFKNIKYKRGAFFF